MRQRRVCHLLFVLLLLISSTSRSASSDQEQASLAGLSALRIVVEAPDDDQDKLALGESALLKEVEARVLAAGIRILGEPAWRATPGRPALKVDVAITGRRKESRVFLVEIELEQDVRLDRDPGKTGPAPTWSAAPRFGLLAPSAGAAPILQAVRDGLDEFVTAWRRANPKR